MLINEIKNIYKNSLHFQKHNLEKDIDKNYSKIIELIIIAAKDLETSYFCHNENIMVGINRIFEIDVLSIMIEKFKKDGFKVELKDHKHSNHIMIHWDINV